MMMFLFVLLLAVAIVVGIVNWRMGVYALILVGVLQDPVRKMMPGTPAYMVLCTLPVWLACIIGLVRMERRLYGRLVQSYPMLAQGAVWFLVSLIPGVFMMLRHGFGVWQVAILGAFGYINPVLALIAGLQFARRPEGVVRLLTFFCLVTVVMLVGTLLEYLNLTPDWSAVGTQVMGHRWVRYRHGYVVHMMTGFYRSPDIMGWHGSMLVMLSLTLLAFLGVGRGGIWGVPASFGALCLLLAGRLKTIMLPPLWIMVMAWSYVRTGKVGQVVLLGGIAVAVLGAIQWASSEVGVTEEYLSALSTSPMEMATRLHGDSIGSVRVTYLQSGFWGKGIGAASTGMRHLGVAIKGTWQEGGLAKVMVELGVPGMLGAFYLMGTIVQAFIVNRRRMSSGGRMAICCRGSPRA